MTKVIPIITSAPIQYSFDGHDIYDSFELVSQGKLTAPLVKNVVQILKNHKFSFATKKIKKIYTAEKGQTVETAKLLISLGIIPNAKIIKTPLLNNINFSMRALIPKEEFIKMSQSEALSIARKIFVEKLYKKSFIESLNDIELRIKDLISLLEKSACTSLCVSHSFYIKFFEIYTEGKNNFKNLDNLINAFNPELKPYEPLEGFDFKI